MATLDPPGGAEVGATVQRVPAIAFAKSARFAAPVAGDAYGDQASARVAEALTTATAVEEQPVLA